jgi:signal transduction histidine kinase/ligand-binding sensor domain-containing protein
MAFLYKLVRHCTVFLLFAHLAFASNVVKKYSPFLRPEDHYYFHRLTVNDGLSQGFVAFIHQDRRGFMWFGTAGGFDRFDGYEFRSYRSIKGIGKEPVYFLSILENNDSTFWIGTDAGLILFNPLTSSGQLFALNPQGGKIATSSVISNITRISDSTLLFDDAAIGLLQFNTISKKFTLLYALQKKPSISPSETFAGIAVMDDGNAAVVTSKQIMMYNPRDGAVRHVISFPASQQANCLWKGTDKSLFIGTKHGILTFGDGKLSRTFADFYQRQVLDNADVRSIFKDTRGTFWIGTEKGLLKLKNIEKTFVYYHSTHSDLSTIQTGAVIGFFEDASENLWMSIMDAGLCRIDLKKKKFFEIVDKPNFAPQLPGVAVSDIDIDNRGNLWIAGGGISYVDRANARITFYSQTRSHGNHDLFLDASLNIPLDDSNLCIVARHRAYLYDIKTEHAREITVHGEQLSSVYKGLKLSSPGLILFSTPDSIFVVNAGKMEFVRTLLRFHNQQILPATAAVTALLQDSAGNIWVGTDCGLLYLNKHGMATRFISDTSSGAVVLPDPCILSLAEGPHGVLWIGTISGLYRYDPKAQTMRGFHDRDGLPNDKIWNIAVDHNNAVWAGTNKGLVKLCVSGSKAYTIRTYTIDDGLPSNEFNMGVVTSDKNGTLYFGSSAGVVFFNPDSMEDNQYQPRVVLTGLEFYGNVVTFEKNMSLTKKLVIPFNTKVFSVHFTALDYTDPSRNHYSYKLEGYNDYWIENGNKREAFYTNLDPGTYTLLIKASNNDNVWTTEPLTIPIVIAPPFWLTWWFKGLVGMTALLSLAWVIRFFELQKIKKRIEMLERQRELERERSRISKDMHDEVGSNLTKIAILSELAQKERGKEQHGYLEKISSSSRDIVDSISHIIWAVDPKNDTLENTIAYIREYLSETFEMTEVRILFEFPEEFPEWSIPSEFRRNVFLTVKEAANNIIKYAHANEVTMTATIFEKTLSVSIRDNGVGFDAEKVARFGNGLTNMRRRIEEIGGMFSIDSCPAQGTAIKLSMPITTFV